MIVYLCPRCKNGRLFLEKNLGYNSYSCMACGFYAEVPIKRTKPPLVTEQVSNKDKKGSVVFAL